MTYTSIQDNKVIPKGITAANGHSIHVAFDNFDRFVDTSSRKYTMHDIDGIIYQFSSNGANFDDGEGTTSSAPQVNDNDNGEGPTRKKRRDV